MNYNSHEWIKTRNEFAALTSAADRLQIAETCLALSWATLYDITELRDELDCLRKDLDSLVGKVNSRLKKFYPDQ